MRDAGRRLAGGHRGWNTGATAVATACRWTIAVFAITAMALSGRAISLPQRAYVWQRAWTSVVRSEVAAHAGTFAAVDVLTAEVSFSSSGPVVACTQVDWRLLAELKAAIGVT